MRTDAADSLPPEVQYPITFEEAVADAALPILANVNDEFPGAWRLRPNLDALKAHIGVLRSKFATPERLGAGDFIALGYEALLWLRQHHDVKAETVMRLVRELVIRKQHDYGHGNILEFGTQGLVVRLSDKWARVENLVSRGGRNAVEGEAIEDTYMDMVGYALIGLMLLGDTFTLPLERDLPRVAEKPTVKPISWSSDPSTAVGVSA